ncbi:MAG: hypothetical protein GY698_09230 [Actinomycetia bacterium]|nr:hypothetical protein [Actinomycetes bacterium]
MGKPSLVVQPQLVIPPVTHTPRNPGCCELILVGLGIAQRDLAVVMGAEKLNLDRSWRVLRAVLAAALANPDLL